MYLVCRLLLEKKKMRMMSCVPISYRTPCTARAPPDISTLSLHDALPIFPGTEDQIVQSRQRNEILDERTAAVGPLAEPDGGQLSDRTDGFGQPAANGFDSDRKSTRLNSSHRCISYAVFCLKKKK